MKTSKLTRALFVLLGLFLFNAASFGSIEIERSKLIELKKRTEDPEGLKKSLPVFPYTLGIFLLDNGDVELLMEGNDATVEVTITKTTGEVYTDSVDCVDGISSYMGVLLDQGEYTIVVSRGRTIWEGTFEIE